MLVSLSRNEIEMLHYCVGKEAPDTAVTPEEVELADLEARLAAILAGEEQC